MKIYSHFSGEAEYVYDIPNTGCDLYSALVITKEGPGTLSGVDPSKALVSISFIDDFNKPFFCNLATGYNYSGVWFYVSFSFSRII
jgi:hypothetical protein